MNLLTIIIIASSQIKSKINPHQDTMIFTNGKQKRKKNFC
jgi:hypothetical protein